MIRPILISSFVILLLFTVSAFAQSPSCVKGDFLKGFGSPNAEQISKLYELENKFCNEIKSDSELESIYGFVSSPKFGQVVRVYKDRAIFTLYNDYARYKERNLNNKEIESLKDLINKINLENQPPILDLERCTDMCSHYEFLSIDNNGGNRVSIFSPGFRPPILLNSLANLFDKWIELGDFQTHYYLQSQIEDVQILFENERFLAKAFWKKDDDFRILTWDRNKDWYEGHSWRKFLNNKIGDKISQPKETPYLTADNKVRRCNDYPFKNGFGEYILCTNLGGKDGLWKVRKDEVIKIKDGIINNPFITPNQKWIIYGKATEDWRNLYYLHYLNTETNEEFKANLPPADFVGAVVYIEAHKKVLITRYQIEGRNRKNNPSPEKPVFYLLDLETGKIERFKNQCKG